MSNLVVALIILAIVGLSIGKIISENVKVLSAWGVHIVGLLIRVNAVVLSKYFYNSMI